MFQKKTGRSTFRSNRRSNYKKNIYSTHKPRVKGNITQLHEKYSKLAKEASSSGDRIQAEYYFQFVDHYSRLISELGLKTQDNREGYENNLENDFNENNAEEKKQIDLSNSAKNNNSKKVEVISKDDESDDSLESVSFISEPVKKKSPKSKKEI